MLSYKGVSYKPYILRLVFHSLYACKVFALEILALIHQLRIQNRVALYRLNERVYSMFVRRRVASPENRGIVRGHDDRMVRRRFSKKLSRGKMASSSVADSFVLC